VANFFWDNVIFVNWLFGSSFWENRLEKNQDGIRFKNSKERKIVLQKSQFSQCSGSFETIEMQEFSNFENFQFVKNTKFSKFFQNLSFYYRDLRPKKSCYNFLAGIEEPIVPTFGGLANIDPIVSLSLCPWTRK
jgi:hypothetical protein